ncbi:hypothetical protein J2X16_004622 [Pelomonas aquatica]|uniref:DUF2946 domain-containing protein n=1 Tax=Pelomonas aquatica TaxID=431058 RepID=A0ABU1ZF44_9BURK|nr:DUF2946 family protein [Pelomonas aquatica]MDR7299254.1 hypothetical protein [Pelomonas aquatica]
MPRLTHARARRQSWWLLAVFVLALLAPGLSAALAHARGDIGGWQDVCRAPSAGVSKPKPVEAALDLLAQGHCPACHHGSADPAAPPPAGLLPLLRSDLAFSAPEHFWSAPRTAHAWVSAPARAPPALH